MPNETIELSADTVAAVKTAQRLRSSPEVLEQRANIREVLDQFMEFLKLDENTAEAFVVYKTILAIDGKSETAKSKAREALDQYIHKWAIAGATEIEIIFK